MVLLEHGEYDEIHQHGQMTEWGWEYDWCEFPYGYTTCPPPELELDWDEHLIEPEPEFLQISDELLADIGV